MSKVESLECPNCGGKLVSAHKARFFICQHCGTKHHLKGIPTDDVVPRLHGTISVGILGGAAIPLMARGTVLPAEVVQSYSTANDNQMNVDVTLVFGENHLTIDNIQIGTFSFGNIAPAPQGVPKIDIRVMVDENGYLTVTATEVFAQREEVIGQVDISGLALPPSRGNSTLSQSYKDELKK